MEIEVKIKELTHEYLVNFLSTVFYGSTTFVPVRYDEYKPLENLGEGDCYEDKMANVLLNGGRIGAIDLEYDDELYVNEGVLAVVNEDGDAEYRFDLNAVKKGLKKALESDDYSLRLAVFNMLVDDGSFDAADAELLIQMIIFGEVIYG